MFTRWSPFVKDPSGPNPVGLVATPTGSSKKNLLNWSDTSTIETNWLVERKTSTTDWVTRDTLVADSTTYTDSVTPGTSYTYRVHAIGAAGSFILSNEATVAGH